jgi:hypothetical protein
MTLFFLDPIPVGAWLSVMSPASFEAHKFQRLQLSPRDRSTFTRAKAFVFLFLFVYTRGPANPRNGEGVGGALPWVNRKRRNHPENGIKIGLSDKQQYISNTQALALEVEAGGA